MRKRELFDAVNRIMAEENCTQAKAIRMLIQRDPVKWADGARSEDVLKKKARTLEKHYSEMRKASS